MKTFALPLLALAFVACTEKGGDDTGTSDTSDMDGDGYTVADGDCDDGDAGTNPGADEVWYDGVDQDCDGNDDDQDGDGYAVDVDCADTSADVNPGADEVCDGVDNDCDGQADVGAADGVTAWVDGDGDGYGAEGTETTVCEIVAGWADRAGDCDDVEPTVYEGAEEICDDLDNDCDGEVNEGSPDEVPYYRDADADGYGDAADSTFGCAPPAGYVADATDCDDAIAVVNPGADEYCDETDRDCDGDPYNAPVDGAAWYADADADGYGDPGASLAACDQPEGYVADASDCDDGDAATYPDAIELCDLEDNDCDGAVDDGAVDERTYYDDGDGDGYGNAAISVSSCGAPSGYVETGDDCDDANSRINPGATELCNGFDDDCDTDVDEDATDATPYYEDDDGDGYGDDASLTASCDPIAGRVTTGGDCDDGSGAVNPAATELCDAVDNDCDGDADEDAAADAATWYADGDGDGYGNAASTASACDAPAGYAASADDCDDADASVSPGAAETCNGYDDDCDGDVDESGAVGETTWYADTDADGYGDAAAALDACDLPTGYSADDTDCDDADATAFPGGAEADDLADNDCDGWVDEDFIATGDVIVSEVTRQPRFGATATNTNGQWFEVYNASSRDIDLSNWYVSRYSSTLGRDGFYVDPADEVWIGAGEYAVFCKTDNYTAIATSYSTLVCDYFWGDETASSSYAGTYRDNTFNLQRDSDTLQLHVGGDASTGTLVDEVTWYYDATSGYWPRDATRSMSLDPAAMDGVSNDAVGSWCSTTNSATYRWYYVSATNVEYGTPGAANYDCP